MNPFKFLQPALLGVDLGSRSVKGVKLKMKAGRVRLVSHFFQDLAETTEDFPENINFDEALKAALQVRQLATSTVAAAIRDSAVSSFQFSMPKMKDKEMRLAVAHELAESAGTDAVSINYDYALVPPAAGTQSDTVEVRAYFAKKETVTERLDQLKRSGLKCKSIETELMAATAMLHFNGYIASEQTQVVIDLGESHIEMGLIIDGELRATKHSRIGLGMINKNLREALGMSYEEAEKKKATYSFSGTEPTGETGAEANQILDNGMTEIFRVIKEGLDFFPEWPESYGKIDRILLIGGGSQIPDIDKVHELFFKIPTTIVNPFKNIDIFDGPNQVDNDEIAKFAPYMATAVGLALVSIEEVAA